MAQVSLPDPRGRFTRSLSVSKPRPSTRGVLARRVFQRAEPYLYLLPALLSIVVWVYRPLLGTLELSGYQWNLLPTTPRVPVGLENYRRVLTLPEMGQALWNTAIYVVGLLPFSVALPLGIALLNQSQGETRRVLAVRLTESEPAARTRDGRLAHPLETG
jgi:multiple sugar transport system permease protein